MIYSCEKIIDIDIPDSERKIVLNSLITPDSLVEIHLSESESILKAGFSMDIIENATVQLYENNSFAALLLYTSEGCYISSDFYPREENQYRVEVSVPGKDPVSSSVLIPDPVKIISIDTNIVIIDKEWAELQVRLKFVDPKEIENYYIVKAKAYGKEPENPALFGPMNVYLESESPIISQYGKPEGGLVFSDKLIHANIYSSETQKGTISNNYGFYSITLPARKIRIHYSYVGYKGITMEFLLNKDTLINITLETSNLLEEIEVRANSIQSNVESSRIRI